VLASILMFRHEEVHAEALPAVKLSFPQLNFRLYVLDSEDAPAVLFTAILVPSWIVPTAVLVGGQPARSARFEHKGEPGSTTGSWEWQVLAQARRSPGGDGGCWGSLAQGGSSGSGHARACLHCVATLGSPQMGAGPQIGSWQQVVDYVRLRNRGYALSRGVLRRIETEQPAVAVSPVTVDLRDAGLPRALLGAPDWPELHSAWVCPEMRMRFDLAPERALAMPRQAPVPG
jgi:hypothetical protein